MYQNYFMCISEPSIHKNKALECSNFGHFLSHFFQFNLYAGRLIREYILIRSTSLINTGLDKFKECTPNDFF
jgi:hypothetical protein